MAKLVKEHFSAVNTAGDALKNKLVKQAGLSEEEAGQLSHDIQSRFKELTQAKKESVLDQTLKNKTTPAQKSAAQKIIEMSNLGAFDKEGINHLAAQDARPSRYEPQLAKEITGMAEHIQSLPEGSLERNFAIQDMMKHISSQIPSGKIDKATNLWLTGLLTGPQTMDKVGLSHTIMNGLEKAKDIPAVALDKTVGSGIARLVNGKGQLSTALTGRGSVSGAKIGLKATKTLLRTGHDTPGTSGFDLNPENNIGRNVNYGNGLVGKFLNGYTGITRNIHAGIPKTFFMSAKQNDLFKQALASAKTNKVERGNLDSFINNFVHNASPEASRRVPSFGADELHSRSPMYLASKPQKLVTFQVASS